MLWLDCDREGENICFEVIENTKHQMNHGRGQQIFRAKFSGNPICLKLCKSNNPIAITAPDINRAMNNLVAPNENEARAVDARQELDLKVQL